MVRRRSSLRTRLSLSYAAIALLTAGLLGGVLVLLLNRHFTAADEDLLRSVAGRTLVAVSEPGADLGRTVDSVAYTMNARVQLLDQEGRPVADSGHPWEIAAPASGSPSGVNAPSDREIRSSVVYSADAPPGAAPGLASVRVSEGPAADRGVVPVVLQAWGVAAGAAVVAAALLGWALSSRVTRPVRALAAASDRMATGDLSARAEIGGNDEIARLAESFNRMAERVSANVSALRRFVSDAAHQIGTPLTALHTDLELLRDDAKDDEARRRAERALAQEERLARLSAGLLQLSRLESRPVPVAPPAVLLAEVGAAVDAVASRADQRAIDLTVQVAEDVGADILVTCPSSVVHDILGNLLDNAVKFTPPGGSVAVEVSADRTSASVVVCDSGPGIPPEERELVLERFYRAPTAAGVPGNGLGLAIAASSASSVGGRVTVLDSGAGARVQARLPLAPVQS